MGTQWIRESEESEGIGRYQGSKGLSEGGEESRQAVEAFGRNSQRRHMALDYRFSAESDVWHG